MSNPTELPDLDRIAALRAALTRISETRFGWDGDCGVTRIADDALYADEQASAAQPEGEAPQARPVACVTDKYSLGGYNDEIDVLLPVGTKLYKRPPAAQHADSGAQASGDVRQKFEAWAEDAGYPTRRGFGNANNYDFVETRRMWESWQAAFAAQSQGLKLCIGVAAPKGATICVMQRHSDGTTTVLYTKEHPVGDSLCVFDTVPSPTK